MNTAERAVIDAAIEWAKTDHTKRAAGFNATEDALLSAVIQLLVARDEDKAALKAEMRRNERSEEYAREQAYEPRYR